MEERLRTKVVVTIGPATESEEMINTLVEEGVDVFRLNFSHGSPAGHFSTIEKIRKCEKEKGKYISILQDLQGPKIRLGTINGGRVLLKEGADFVLTKHEIAGDDKICSISDGEVIDDVKIGEPVYIDDGLIKLRVKRKDKDSILTEVIEGGFISDRKGVNFPQTLLSLPAITEKDRNDLKLGIEKGVDFVALSFVRNAGDIISLRDFMNRFGRVVPIIAKIEKWEAVKNIEGIVEEADGVMVARGDLGVELPLEEVPIIQKHITHICNSMGKPVIIATQMLNSMIEHPIPTRAEVNDISNAILDGSDALMLSNETAIGKFPLESVKTMKRVILTTEGSDLFRLSIEGYGKSLDNSIPDAIAFSVKSMAIEVGAKLIITATESGKTANLVSKYKPPVPILAMTPNKETLFYLNLKWGVYPVIVKRFKSVDEILYEAPRIALWEKIISKGDLYIITAGFQTGVSGSTNLIKIDRA